MAAFKPLWGYFYASLLLKGECHLNPNFSTTLDWFACSVKVRIVLLFGLWVCSSHVTNCFGIIWKFGPFYCFFFFPTVIASSEDVFCPILFLWPTIVFYRNLEVVPVEWLPFRVPYWRTPLTGSWLWVQSGTGCPPPLLRGCWLPDRKPKQRPSSVRRRGRLSSLWGLCLKPCMRSRIEHYWRRVGRIHVVYFKRVGRIHIDYY